ncbi:7029_t:CDS:2, partial [Ambispora leptoticha]
QNVAYCAHDNLIETADNALDSEKQEKFQKKLEKNREGEKESVNRIIEKKQLSFVSSRQNLGDSEDNFSSYQNLQSESQFFVSALQGTGLDDLTAKIINFLPLLHQEKVSNLNNGLNLLIFGAPNSGKSTLMNYLLQENRSVVSSVAGTTQEP